MTSVYKLKIYKSFARVKMNYLIAMQVQKIAVGIDWMAQMIVWLRCGLFDSLLPSMPEPGEWFKLYADHRRVTKAVNREMFDVLGDDVDVQEAIDTTRAIGRNHKGIATKIARSWETESKHNKRKAISDICAKRDIEYKRHLEEIMSGLRGDLSGPDDLSQRMKRSPELLFYYRVFLPCFVIYHKYPPSLIRHVTRAKNEAQRTKAIEEWVRLDPMAIHHESIERWMNGPDSGDTRKYRRESVHRWASEGLDHGRFSRMQMYQMMGGMIWALVDRAGIYIEDFSTWKICKPQIKAEDIRQIFLSALEDRKKLAVNDFQPWEEPDPIIDQLLELELHSWRAGIKKSRKLWMNMTWLKEKALTTPLEISPSGPQAEIDQNYSARGASKSG